MMGRLLVSHGKFEACMKYLQRVPPLAVEHAEAIKLLSDCASALGLTGGTTAMGPENEGLANTGGPPARELLLGRYQLIAQWATTPTARILRCRDQSSGYEVALKWFCTVGPPAGSQGAAARVVREVRALELLRHPHIVRLLDYCEDGPVLVRPWMAGGTLGDLIARGPIVPARALEIVSAILDALGEAHRIGIVHRDLKPSNVLFDDAGTPHLADFGVAHMGDASATMTAAVIGTIGFMSPEQHRGDAASPQSDLYGAGALLLAMLTGEQQDIAGAPLPSRCHRNLTVAHDAVIAALLATDPAERPESAYAAKSMLLTVAWPGTLEAVQGPRGAVSEAKPHSVRDRLSAAGVDTFTGNLIEALPLTPDRLARARAFARARAAVFQAVLRVDETRSELWLERRSGAAVTYLSQRESALIVHTLDELWSQGHAHGRLAQGGLYRDKLGCLRIAFSWDTDATRESDILAINSLMAPQ
jgi:serine/threonine-protein kinase